MENPTMQEIIDTIDENTKKEGFYIQASNFPELKVEDYKIVEGENYFANTVQEIDLNEAFDEFINLGNHLYEDPEIENFAAVKSIRNISRSEGMVSHNSYIMELLDGKFVITNSISCLGFTTYSYFVLDHQPTDAEVQKMFTDHWKWEEEED